MDDTLVNTRDKWIGAIKEYMSMQNLPYDEEAIAPYLGKNCRDICHNIDARYNHIGSRCIEHHANIFRRCLIGQFSLKMPQEIPGASRFLGIMNKSVKQYVVSGSPLQVIAQVIRHNGWSSFIMDYNTSETLPKGKPDPRIYNDIQERLGAKKAECLIFEDSPAGVEAARRAGIKCICINPHAPIGQSDLLICTVADFQALIDSNTISELMESELSHELN